MRKVLNINTIVLIITCLIHVLYISYFSHSITVSGEIIYLDSELFVLEHFLNKTHPSLSYLYVCVGRSLVRPTAFFLAFLLHKGKRFYCLVACCNWNDECKRSSEAQDFILRHFD